MSFDAVAHVEKGPLYHSMGPESAKYDQGLLCLSNYSTVANNSVGNNERPFGTPQKYRLILASVVSLCDMVPFSRLCIMTCKKTSVCH